MNYALPEFLAHAIALEHEAAERYLELADMMEAHRNDAVSALFRDMVHYSRLHHDSIVERARGVTLPRSAVVGVSLDASAGSRRRGGLRLHAGRLYRAALRARKRGAGHGLLHPGRPARRRPRGRGGWQRNSRARKPSTWTPSTTGWRARRDRPLRGATIPIGLRRPDGPSRCGPTRGHRARGVSRRQWQANCARMLRYSHRPRMSSGTGIAWMRRRSCASRTQKTRVSRLSQISSSPRVTVCF